MLCFQDFLRDGARSPLAAADDNSRDQQHEGVIVYLGVVAQFLPPTDPKARAVLLLPFTAAGVTLFVIVVFAGCFHFRHFVQGVAHAVRSRAARVRSVSDRCGHFTADIPILLFY